MLKNIVLIGFMGAGKSAVAQKLAQRLNRPVVSIDEVIVQREGRPITDIFQRNGESYFRQVEKGVVAEFSSAQDLIIDCGGGVVLNPENTFQLKKGGVLFYLRAAPQTIFERIKDQRHRPLLNVPDPMAKIQELLNQRQPHYSQADFIIDTDALTTDQVCDRVLELAR